MKSNDLWRSSWEETQHYSVERSDIKVCFHARFFMALSYCIRENGFHNFLKHLILGGA